MACINKKHLIVLALDLLKQKNRRTSPLPKTHIGPGGAPPRTSVVAERNGTARVCRIAADAASGIVGAKSAARAQQSLRHVATRLLLL